MFICSVSGGSATIYAYLGEFHTNQSRSKAIMGASVVFGIAALLMPGFAWLVINQSFQFYIPFLDIVYKPWRLFLLVCGLPSLISSLCLFVIPESPKYTLLYKGQDDTIRILSRVYSINTGNERETYPVRQSSFTYICYQSNWKNLIYTLLEVVVFSNFFNYLLDRQLLATFSLEFEPVSQVQINTSQTCSSPSQFFLEEIDFPRLSE